MRTFLVKFCLIYSFVRQQLSHTHTHTSCQTIQEKGKENHDCAIAYSFVILKRLGSLSLLIVAVPYSPNPLVGCVVGVTIG